MTSAGGAGGGIKPTPNSKKNNKNENEKEKEKENKITDTRRKEDKNGIESNGAYLKRLEQLFRGNNNEGLNQAHHIKANNVNDLSLVAKLTNKLFANQKGGVSGINFECKPGSKTDNALKTVTAIVGAAIKFAAPKIGAMVGAAATAAGGPAVGTITGLAATAATKTLGDKFSNFNNSKQISPAKPTPNNTRKTTDTKQSTPAQKTNENKSPEKSGGLTDAANLLTEITSVVNGKQETLSNNQTDPKTGKGLLQKLVETVLNPKNINKLKPGGNNGGGP